VRRFIPFAAAALIGCAGRGNPADDPSWRPLFDGATLAGWSVVSGAAGGPVDVADGRIVLGRGEPMTLIALAPPAAGAFPRDGFEIELVAARVLGDDFFVGLTFPAGDGALTLILGGWGGSLCGLSCLDGEDAASNETKSFRRFERGRDYRVAVRVLHGRVTATVDGAVVADVDTRRRHCSLRREVEPCGPLGLATYQTVARITELRWRPIER
jgi:hypothetical protein